MTQAPTPSTRDQVREQLTAHMPLAWVALAFLGGIRLASWKSLPVSIWLACAGVALLLTLLARRFVRLTQVTLLGLSLLGLFLGAARYQQVQHEVTAFDVAFFNDREYDLLVTGWVTEMPDRRDTYTNLRIQVEAVDSGTGDLPADGILLVRVGENEIHHYGERLRLRGQLETPPADDEFSYRDYLAREGIYSYMTKAEVTVLPGERGDLPHKWMFALKEKMLAHIYRLFPDPEASLLAGILLGVDTGLTRELQDAFKNTGTAHIIAISGFNISIIAGIFVSLFSRWFGPRLGAVVAILGIAFYTLLVGADSAVVRAAIMGVFSLLARQVGRRNLGLNTLSIVALIMALANPLVIWDVGFQLSFFATLGLILYAEPLSNLVKVAFLKLRVSPATIEQILPPLSDFVLLTLAAQITTLPIMAYHFKRISIVSLISNPFVLPPQPAVMILGGIAVLLSLAWFPLGQLAAWAAWPFVEYTIRAVEFFDSIPHGTLYLGDSSPWLVAAFYGILFGLTLSWSRLKEALSALGVGIRNLSIAGILTALLAVTLLVWRSTASLPDGQLHVTFLSVGSADAVLIQTPDGRSVLVNGGPSASNLSDELGRRLPVFQRELDWLVVASTTENQMSALPRVLERYPPQSVLWSGYMQASYSAEQVDKYLAAANIPVIYAEPGQRLDLGEGAILEVLSVGSRGSILLIEWHDFRALLPIGMSSDTMEALEYGNAIGPVDVLLLADSGFFATTNIDWVQNLNPQLIVLSVAAGDPDGLPSPEALEAAGGYTLLRTDRSGWIHISTDGNSMQVEAEREAADPLK
ncbi:MAG: ComEC/Rec2 family competence protein [Chloroflexi bacterium]|nr:ComEC/Rec2 family competence protein [Chloroflexota bacterium]